jgi:hypothetical protein
MRISSFWFIDLSAGHYFSIASAQVTFFAGDMQLKSRYGFDCSFSEIASSTLSGKVDASSSMALN